MPAYVKELPKPQRCGEDTCARMATHQVYNAKNNPVGAPRCEKHARLWVADINGAPIHF